MKIPWDMRSNDEHTLNGPSLYKPILHAPRALRLAEWNSELLSTPVDHYEPTHSGMAMTDSSDRDVYHESYCGLLYIVRQCFPEYTS